jgi:hypothetical protein
LLQWLRLPIKGKRSPASRPLAERPDKGVRERSGSRFESDHRGEGFLFILNAKRIRLQDSLDSRGDFMIGQAVNAMRAAGICDDADGAAARPRSGLRFGDRAGLIQPPGGVPAAVEAIHVGESDSPDMHSPRPSFLREGRLYGQSLPDPLWQRGESHKTTHDHSLQ